MSCLFDSIGRRLHKDGSVVRREICDYMAAHRDVNLEDMTLRQWVEAVEGVPYERYLKEMRHSGTWGTYFELLAASALYDCDIVILYGTDVIRINDDKKYEITLNYTGNHFY